MSGGRKAYGAAKKRTMKLYRANEAEYDLLKAAARVLKYSTDRRANVSTFVREAALREARRVLGLPAVDTTRDTS